MRHYGDQELAKVPLGFSVWENPDAITFWQWVAGPQSVVVEKIIHGLQCTGYYA